MTEPPPVVALFGATALGKTDVALELAERLDADIVVADSMQVYAGLPILTNQPDADARARARHHLVGFVVAAGGVHASPSTRARAHEVVDGLRRAGRRVVVEGGSGLYLRAALGDLAFGGAPDPALRRRARGTLGARPGRPRARAAPARPRTWRRASTCATRAASSAPWRRWTAGPGGGRLRRAADATSSGGRPSATRTGSSRSCRTTTARRSSSASTGASTRCSPPARSRRSRRPARPARSRARPRRRSACASSAPSSTASSALDEAAARMKARTRALARRQLTWMRKLPDAALVPAPGRPRGRRRRRRPRPSRDRHVVGCRFRRGASRRALSDRRGS